MIRANRAEKAGKKARMTSRRGIPGKVVPEDSEAEAEAPVTKPAPAQGVFSWSGYWGVYDARARLSPPGRGFVSLARFEGAVSRFGFGGPLSPAPLFMAHLKRQEPGSFRQRSPPARGNVLMSISSDFVMQGQAV